MIVEISARMNEKVTLVVKVESDRTKEELFANEDIFLDRNEKIVRENILEFLVGEEKNADKEDPILRLLSIDGEAL